MVLGETLGDHLGLEASYLKDMSAFSQFGGNVQAIRPDCPYKEQRKGFPGMMVAPQRKMLGTDWKRIHDEWQVCTERINPMNSNKPSALPPVYLIIEDREHITLGRATHSERGRSTQHRYWCFLRRLWMVHSKVTLVLSSDAPYIETLSPGSQKSYCLSQPAAPLNSYWLLSEGVGVVLYV